MVATTQKTRSVLDAEVRQGGSKNASVLRRTGKLPGIVYGLGSDSVPITLDAAATEHAVHSGAHLDNYLQVIVLHLLDQHVLDFAVDLNHKVKVKVPLDFRGTPKGTKEGGILE